MELRWLVLAVFVLAMAFDHLVLWRLFERRRAAGPDRARHALWAGWFLMLWTCAGLVLGLFAVERRPLSALGLGAPGGWRLWGAVLLAGVLVALQGNGALRIARMTGDRTPLRERVGTTGLVLPRRTAELPAWGVLSITAGFCEELLFRGFLVWILQPALGAWGAALASVVVFALAHAYQGREGLVRSGVAAALFTVLCIVTGSRWPAIVLHALADAMGGVMGWLILREPAPAAPVVRAAGA